MEGELSAEEPVSAPRGEPTEVQPTALPGISAGVKPEGEGRNGENEEHFAPAGDDDDDFTRDSVREEDLLAVEALAALAPSAGQCPDGDRRVTRTCFCKERAHSECRGLLRAQARQISGRPRVGLHLPTRPARFAPRAPGLFLLVTLSDTAARTRRRGPRAGSDGRALLAPPGVQGGRPVRGGEGGDAHSRGDARQEAAGGG